MIVSVLASGSRGDVQPPAALALALAGRGHHVRLITNREFAGLVEGSDVRFCPLPVDIRAELQSPKGREFFAGAGNPVRLLRWVYDIARRYTAETTPLVRDYVADSDVILGTGLVDYFASVMGRLFNKPCVHAYMQPFVPTRDFPCPVIPPPPFDMPGWMNRLEAHLYTEIVWLISRPLARMIHESLQLPPPTLRSDTHVSLRAGDHFLMAYSEALLPRGTDWPANVAVTGYWYLHRMSNWQVPPALARFIESGPAPIYVGFGSMMMKNPTDTVTAVLDAVRRTGSRAIISEGWGGMRPTSVPDNVFVAEVVPHEWLFPRVAAVIHHGGAGTIGAALSAGVPQIIVPFITDQFFWARQLEKRGIAPRAVRHSCLTAESLTAAIRLALNDAGMRKRAADTAVLVRGEDGTRRAADILERTAMSRGIGDAGEGRRRR